MSAGQTAAGAQHDHPETGVTGQALSLLSVCNSHSDMYKAVPVHIRASDGHDEQHLRQLCSETQSLLSQCMEIQAQMQGLFEEVRCFKAAQLRTAGLMPGAPDGALADSVRRCESDTAGVALPSVDLGIAQQPQQCQLPQPVGDAATGHPGDAEQQTAADEGGASSQHGSTAALDTASELQLHSSSNKLEQWLPLLCSAVDQMQLSISEQEERVRWALWRMNSVRRAAGPPQPVSPPLSPAVLHRLVEKGDVKRLHGLICQGGDVDARHPESGGILLMSAVDQGSMAMVEALVGLGADVNAIDTQPRLPSRAVYKTFRLAGAKQPAGATALTEAEVKLGGRGTALMRAAFRGRQQVLHYLLQRGADVHARDAGGYTALRYAVEADRPCLSCIRALVEAGSDVNSRCLDGNCVVHIAAKFGCKVVAQLLMGAAVDLLAVTSDGRSLLMCATHDAELTDFLIKAGVDVNWCSSSGQTALMVACSDGGSEATVELLLQAGADVNKVAPWSGQTPLMTACLNSVLFGTLLRYGADPCIADKEGRTALDVMKELRATGAMVPQELEAMRLLEEAMAQRAQAQADKVAQELIEEEEKDKQRAALPAKKGKGSKSRRVQHGTVGAAALIGGQAGDGKGSGACVEGMDMKEEASETQASSSHSSSNTQGQAEALPARVPLEHDRPGSFSANASTGNGSSSSSSSLRSQPVPIVSEPIHPQAASGGRAPAPATGPSSSSAIEPAHSNIVNVSTQPACPPTQQQGDGVQAACVPRVLRDAQPPLVLQAALAAVARRSAAAVVGGAGSAGSSSTAAALPAPIRPEMGVLPPLAPPAVGAVMGTAASTRHVEQPAAVPLQPAALVTDATSVQQGVLASACQTSSSSAPAVIKQQRQEQKQSSTRRAKIDWEERALCVVCMERERSMALAPCGHAVLCGKCCADIQSATNECPMCRSTIQLALKLIY